MKHLYGTALLTAVLLGCSTKPDLNLPAIAITPTPFYKSQKEVSGASSSGTIPALDQLFLKGDSLIVDGKKFIRISWNNRSGYALANDVLEEGRRGVIFGSPTTIFEDQQMTIVETRSDISVALIGRKIPGGREVALPTSKAMFRGFVTESSCFTDSLDIVFATKITAAWDALKSDPFNPRFNSVFDDPAFSHLPLRKLYVDDYHARQAADTIKHEVARWVDSEGKLLTQAETPGIFGVGYIFEDGTESTRNHLGDDLSNDISSCSNKRITGLKMYFVPAMPMEYFVFNANSSNQEGKPMVAQDSVKAPELGKRYSFISFRGDCNDVLLELITGKGERGTGTISESCGD